MIVTPSNMRRLAEDLPAQPDRRSTPAPDRRAPAAREAAGFCQEMAFNLLAMASPNVLPDKRQEAAALVFQIWRPLCTLMAELEAACPNASEAGYGQAAALAEIAGRGRVA